MLTGQPFSFLAAQVAIHWQTFRALLIALAQPGSSYLWQGLPLVGVFSICEIS